MYTTIWHIFICLGFFYLWDMFRRGYSQVLDIVLVVVILSISHYLSLSILPNAFLILGLYALGGVLNGFYPTHLLSHIIWDFRKDVNDSD